MSVPEIGWWCKRSMETHRWGRFQPAIPIRRAQDCPTERLLRVRPVGDETLECVWVETRERLASDAHRLRRTDADQQDYAHAEAGECERRSRHLVPPSAKDSYTLAAAGFASPVLTRFPAAHAQTIRGELAL